MLVKKSAKDDVDEAEDMVEIVQEEEAMEPPPIMRREINHHLEVVVMEEEKEEDIITIKKQMKRGMTNLKLSAIIVISLAINLWNVKTMLKKKPN